MPSIALFPCIPSLDSGIVGEISIRSNLHIYNDENLFRDTAAQFSESIEKLRSMMYGRTSVANQFTHEKEKVINMFRQVLAERISVTRQYLFHGLLVALIPFQSKVILRVVAVDTKDNRIVRGMRMGLSRSEARRGLRRQDKSATNWTRFLFQKDPYDVSLHDMVIFAGGLNHRQVTKEILHCLDQMSAGAAPEFPKINTITLQGKRLQNQ